MNSLPAAKFVNCPKCGADYLAGEAKSCWICGSAMKGAAPNATGTFQYRPVRLPDGTPVDEEDLLRPSNLPRRPMQYSLATLLAVVTLVSAELGLLVNAPSLGVIAGVLLLPAIARAWAVESIRKGFGLPALPVGSFFESLGLMLLLTMLAVFLGGVSLYVLVVTSLVLGDRAGVVLFALCMCVTFLLPAIVYVRVWPQRDSPRYLDNTW